VITSKFGESRTALAVRCEAAPPRTFIRNPATHHPLLRAETEAPPALRTRSSQGLRPPESAQYDGLMSGNEYYVGIGNEWSAMARRGRGSFFVLGGRIRLLGDGFVLRFDVLALRGMGLGYVSVWRIAWNLRGQ